MLPVSLASSEKVIKQKQSDIKVAESKILKLRMEIGEELLYVKHNHEDFGAHGNFMQWYKEKFNLIPRDVQRYMGYAEQSNYAALRNLDAPDLLDTIGVTSMDEVIKKDTPPEAVQRVFEQAKAYKEYQQHQQAQLELPEDERTEVKPMVFNSRVVKDIIKKTKDELGMSVPEFRKLPFKPKTLCSLNGSIRFPTERKYILERVSCFVPDLDNVIYGYIDDMNMEECPLHVFNIDLDKDFTRSEMKRIKTIVSKAHPDKGGDGDEFNRLNALFDKFKARYNLR